MEYREKKFKSGGDKGKKSWKKENAGRNGNNGRDVNGKTIDFMTAESAEIPYEVLQKVTSRIINEVSHVNRVMYDITSKPPGTIEFE